VPTGFASTGLPLSMQIIGKPFDEATVYRVARAYEQATPWTTRHPVLA
jgi:aspartyl-tRNA(Asn)/glutamyl-tRNA(Gln) amidotransferase subunit A